MPRQDSITPWRRSDVIYVSLAIFSVFYGYGEIAYHVIVAILAVIVVLPLLSLTVDTAVRAAKILMLCLVTSFLLGALYKEVLIQYASTLPELILARIDAHKLRTGNFPKSVDELNDLPWLPPILRISLSESGTTFFIHSKRFYSPMLYYDLPNRRWIHWKWE